MQVLAARDARARRREQALLAGGAGAVGELGLNVPGWPKLGREWLLPFARGLEAMLAVDPSVRVMALRADAAGYWALLRGPSPALEHKRASCRIEDAAPWGRLLDFDWYGERGKLPRELLGLPARRCWLCGAEQGLCISGLRHEIRHVRAAAFELARSVRDPAQNRGERR